MKMPNDFAIFIDANNDVVDVIAIRDKSMKTLKYLKSQALRLAKDRYVQNPYRILVYTNDSWYDPEL